MRVGTLGWSWSLSKEKSLSPKEIVGQVVGRWASGWPNALACALAASLSWVCARALFGHPQPVFTAVAAIACLSPGLPNHARQALNLMLGVVTGIVVGEILLVAPEVSPVLHIGVITFAAIMAALSFNLAPVTAIQASVSALLVIALGPATAGPARLLDVTVGASVGLILSQVLLTPDPVRVIDEAAHNLLRVLARGFAESAAALAGRDARRAQAALQHLFAGHDSLVALGAGIASAQSSTRWTVRGRLAAQEVAERAARYDRRAIRLYASSLLFSEALANALRRGDEPPPALAQRIARVAQIVLPSPDQPEGPQDPAPASAIEPLPAPSWRACLDHLEAVEHALRALRDPSASLAHRPAAG